MRRLLCLLLLAPPSWSCRATARPIAASWSDPVPGPAAGPAGWGAAELSLELGPPPSAERGAVPESLRPGRPEPGTDEGYEWKRFGLSLGAQLIADLNTVLRVDSETLGRGTEVDLEDDFSVDDSLFLGRIDANWRMAEKHELEFSLFQLRREGTRVVDRDIQIGDVVFPLDTAVTSEFETTVVKLAYRYAFLHRPRWHVGASLGAHTMDWTTSWTAGTLALEEDFDFLVPLPVVGFFGSYALTPRLYLNASSEVFGLEYEEFDGFLNNTRLNLEHRTFAHLGFGVGLDYFLIDASLENESGRLSASAEYDYLGLVGFVRFY